MYLSQLLALVSTLPIGMAMGGPHGPEDQSISLMNNFDGRQHAPGIDELARRSRHGSRSLLALSTLAAAVVLSFLIMRCYNALEPRENNMQYSRTNSRRLAYYVPSACSPYVKNLAQEFDQEEEEEEELEQDDEKTQKWLKIGLLFTAGTIITGLATMGATYFLAERRAELAAMTDDKPAMPAMPAMTTPSPEMLYEIAKARLTNQLPSRTFRFKEGQAETRVDLPLEKLNGRIVNYFLGLSQEAGTYEELKDELTSFAQYQIEAVFADMFDTDFNKLSNEIQDAARRIRDRYAASVGIMTVTTQKLRFEPERAQLKQRIKRRLPNGTFKFVEEDGAESRLDLPIEKLNGRLVNYFLTLNEEPLTDEDMAKELIKYAKYHLRPAFESMSRQPAKQAAAKRVEDLYVDRIKMIVQAHNLRNTWRRIAQTTTTRAEQATEEAIKHVTSTVANTVKAIEDGTFTFGTEPGSGFGSGFGEPETLGTPSVTQGKPSVTQGTPSVTQGTPFETTTPAATGILSNLWSYLSRLWNWN